MNRQEKTDIESTLAHASLPVFSAKGAAITVADKFSVTLETIRRPRQDMVLSNAAAMLLMALEKKTELLEWATNQILPSHLLYTLTQVLVQEARRDWDKLNTVPALTPILDRLGGPVSEKTRRMVLSERVDPKTATVALIHDLWGRPVDRSNLDTAYTKKGEWRWQEAIDLVSSMLKGAQILRDLPPRRTLAIEEKRWAVLVGAHIHRASRGETGYHFELSLSEKLLPQAQRLAWLRDAWLRAGERAFPLMIQIEPLLAKRPDVARRKFG
jgi:hypothetical protein